MARAYGIFGSIDINRGDARNGWDTDQFPNNAQELVPSLVQLVQDQGFTTGGFNFDAKLRRQSVDPLDLYVAHIGGIDTIARALLGAADVVREGKLEALVENYNIVLRAKGAKETEKTVLSTDGSEGNHYVVNSIAWSPDCRRKEWR